MPKRVIDGEGLWRSDKLARVEPASFRAEYANLLPLALANGVFEANPRRIWATVYSYNRPDVSLETVEQILAEFERVGLLVRWTDSTSDKQWGYFVGINKPGRLPPPSRLREGHEALGPEPPKELLRRHPSDAGMDGKPTANHEAANGSLGFGFGFGSGFGSGFGTANGEPVASQQTTTTEATPEKSSQFNSTEVAQILCQQNGWSGKGMIWALQAALEFQAKQMPELELEEVGEWLLKAYSNHRSAKGDFAVGPQKFFEQGLYRSPADRRDAKSSVLLDNPATRALAQLEAN